MFDQLGGVDIRHKHRGHEWLVDFLHESDGPLAVAADNDAVGLHEIGHGAAFAQELGITHHIKFGTSFVVTADRIGDLLTGFNRNSALVHNDAVLALLEDCGDLAGYLLYVRQIDAAIGLRRCGNGDEHHIGVIHALLGARSEIETLRGHIAVDQLFEARFVDWNFSGEQLLDFFLIVVHASDRVAHFSEAGT